MSRFLYRWTIAGILLAAVAGALVADDKKSSESENRTDPGTDLKLDPVTVGGQVEGTINTEHPIAVMNVVVPDEGLFALNVRGKGSQKSDIGLELEGPDGVRQWDKDMGGDYNAESMLFRKPGTYTVRVKQINEKLATVKLDIRLVRVEPKPLVLDKADSGKLVPSSPVAYYSVKHDSNSVMQLNLEAGRGALMITIIRPDGSLDFRELDVMQDRFGERIVLEKKPQGVYFLEVRRKDRGESDYAIAYRAFDENYTPQTNTNNPNSTNPDGPDTKPVTTGVRLQVGWVTTAKLTPDFPRVKHALTVQGSPVAVDVTGNTGDLRIVVSGPFVYNSDLDYEKNQAHELVVLPFAGEYELVVQRMDSGKEDVEYRISTMPVVADVLKPGETLKHEVGLGKTHLYRVESKVFPVIVDVQAADKSPDAGDILLTSYARHKDGRVVVQNVDSDMNGYTAHERAVQEEEAQMYILVRQGAGKLKTIPYRVQILPKEESTKEKSDAKGKQPGKK